ncbi:hypothetical protein LTR74_007132 [Friedmanniomyces endolithicus]|nr:hypothetical protein LTR74_007132 [Friedmanniomyces endolithicus]
MNPNLVDPGERLLIIGGSSSYYVARPRYTDTIYRTQKLGISQHAVHAPPPDIGSDDFSSTSSDLFSSTGSLTLIRATSGPRGQTADSAERDS